MSCDCNCHADNRICECCCDHDEARIHELEGQVSVAGDHIIKLREQVQLHNDSACEAWTKAREFQKQSDQKQARIRELEAERLELDKLVIKWRDKALKLEQELEWEQEAHAKTAQYYGEEGK